MTTLLGMAVGMTGAGGALFTLFKNAIALTFVGLGNVTGAGAGAGLPISPGLVVSFGFLQSQAKPSFSSLAIRSGVILVDLPSQ